MRRGAAADTGPGKCSRQRQLGFRTWSGADRHDSILYPRHTAVLVRRPPIPLTVQTGEITTFKPYSKFPPCYKDVSFWVPEGGLHDNDVFDLVRDAVGDLAEDVKMIDSFVHPKTSKTSRCYRINYRSMDRSLSNEETNTLHAGVVSRLGEEFGVEIR